MEIGGPTLVCVTQRKRGVRPPRGGGKRLVRFGELLKTIRLRSRELKGRRSLDSVVQRLHGLGIDASRSGLSRYETASRTPDAVVLIGLADVYGVSRSELFDAMIRDANGEVFETARLASDLLGHTRTIEKRVTPHKGGSADAADSVTAGLLESVRQEHAELRRLVEQHARAILDAVHVRPEDGEAENPQAETSGGHRGTHQ